MEIFPWVIAALVAVGSFAFFVRIMQEEKRELRAEISILKADIVKLNEYIDIQRGDITQLTGDLRAAQSALTAEITKAKIKRELDQIEHPTDETHGNGRIDTTPQADWVGDDE